ncbi:MAG: hypothetical protein NTW55_07830 [Planctomycetota bacterium]|nr:hypothetical protein [Planctomycetota bacterium]
MSGLSTSNFWKIFSDFLDIPKNKLYFKQRWVNKKNKRLPMLAAAYNDSLFSSSLLGGAGQSIEKLRGAPSPFLFKILD